MAPLAAATLNPPPPLLAAVGSWDSGRSPGSIDTDSRDRRVSVDARVSTEAEVSADCRMSLDADRRAAPTT